VDATLCAASIHDLLAIRQRDESGDLSKQKRLEFQCLEKVTEIIASNECFTLQKLAVTGRDLIVLGYSQGHELGETLNMLLNHVLEHPEDNKRETLLKIVME
jgi:tRNA nucleotidyltransferase (CCA-adding enzyme)